MSVFKKKKFIQKIFTKLIETVIVKIDIVWKRLYFEYMLLFWFLYLTMNPQKYHGFQKKNTYIYIIYIYNIYLNIYKNKQHNCFQYW